MRILIVTNNYTPYSGGVVSSLNALIPAMQQAGHEVLLVAPQFLAVHADDPIWVWRVPSLVRFTWHNNHMVLPLRTERFLANVMQEFKPDIVHVQHPFLLGVAACKVARTLGIPVAFTYHTMYEAYAHYVPLPRRFVQWVILKSVKRFCNAVDTVVVPTHAVQVLLLERGITTPMVVIPSPLQDIFLRSYERKKEHFLLQVSPHKRVSEQHDDNLESVFSTDSKKKETTSLFNERHDNRLVLLSVGRFVPEKNMQAALDLYAQLPHDQFRLVLVGYGSLYQALQEYAYAVLKLSRTDVQFVHKPPQEVIAQWYVDADFFIFTSPTDTQGLVLVEAMAGGTPVLAVDGPGQRDSVHDGHNGFIVLSLAHMREQIIEIAENPALHERLCAGAIEVAQNYHPKEVVGKLELFYKTLI